MLLHPVENSLLELPNGTDVQASLSPKDRERKGTNNTNELHKKQICHPVSLQKGKLLLEILFWIRTEEVGIWHSE